MRKTSLLLIPCLLVVFLELVSGTTASGQAPAITTHPTSLTVTAGHPATFTVVASGTAPLSYQWQKDGAAITGATSSTYTTPLTVGSDNGAMFTVVVSNSAGSVTSNPAMLTVPDKKSFEVLTGVGAVVSGVEDTSYAINNDTNALAATNIGRKRIELLLGGGFIMPFHRGGVWIDNAYPKDPDYRDYRPWETFLSIRFAPGSDQTINGFVVGGGYRITKYFSLLVGYSATPMDEPAPGFRLAASQIVANNPTIFPYSRYNATDLLNNKPGAFDGFPVFIYNASGATTQKLFLTSPTVTHYRSGTYFGVGIPLNLTQLFKPSK